MNTFMNTYEYIHFYVKKKKFGVLFNYNALMHNLKSQLSLKVQEQMRCPAVKCSEPQDPRAFSKFIFPQGKGWSLAQFQSQAAALCFTQGGRHTSSKL